MAFRSSSRWHSSKLQWLLLKILPSMYMFNNSRQYCIILRHWDILTIYNIVIQTQHWLSSHVWSYVLPGLQCSLQPLRVAELSVYIKARGQLANHLDCLGPIYFIYYCYVVSLSCAVLYLLSMCSCICSASSIRPEKNCLGRFSTSGF